MLIAFAEIVRKTRTRACIILMINRSRIDVGVPRRFRLEFMYCAFCSEYVEISLVEALLTFYFQENYQYIIYNRFILSCRKNVEFIFVISCKARVWYNCKDLLFHFHVKGSTYVLYHKALIKTLICTRYDFSFYVVSFNEV